ncbi:sporulation protein YunB [Natranaerobius trueperi]|uniref:Sporulation protein YunB n=1 Tax=Natranaerobius trueperi TaxID=759412 RepID=A0A226BX23_9FIRM|nr:sporulation protein YunB [Natranaerobius trueperi]OWZ82874.1 sporulation protein YunB [Natranaerobius trueperi]
MFKKPLSKRMRGFVPLIIITIVIFILIQFFLFIENSLRPTFLAIAEARAKIIAFDAINEAINERVAQNIMYEDLIIVDKDSQGSITMAQTNTMEVNRVQAETVKRVQNTLRDIEGEKINIPLGQVLGSQILATYGPKIPVTLVPIGTVHVDVSHSFKEAGINQTRHKIYLDVFADVQIIIPFVSTSREVKTAVPVADTIYMGDVPDTVVNLPLPTRDGAQGSENIQSNNQSNTNTQNDFFGNQESQNNSFIEGNESNQENIRSIPYFNR